MSDIVSGRYQTLDPNYSALGQLTNIAQSDIPARSNLSVLGGGALTENVLTTGKQATALIPVSYGDLITAISVPVAGTEGEAASETFVALYSGAVNGKTSTLLAQGTSVKAAVTKEALFTQNLTAPVLITPTVAPFGYVYAAITSTATTIAAVACWKVKPKA